MNANRVNAVIVGAGAGGGVVAKELSEAGLTVILFERGGWPSFEAHDHDELISQRTTVLGNAFGPDDQRHRRVIQSGNGSWQDRPAQRTRLWEQCGLRRLGNRLLRCHGLALHAAGLPHAFDVWNCGRLDAG